MPASADTQITTANNPESSPGRWLDKNLGQIFPWWDRLFHSYLEQPRAGHEKMIIGISGFQDDRNTRILPLLMQPLEQ